MKGERGEAGTGGEKIWHKPMYGTDMRTTSGKPKPGALGDMTRK